MRNVLSLRNHPFGTISGARFVGGLVSGFDRGKLTTGFGSKFGFNSGLLFADGPHGSGVDFTNGDGGAWPVGDVATVPSDATGWVSRRMVGESL